MRNSKSFTPYSTGKITLNLRSTMSNRESTKSKTRFREFKPRSEMSRRTSIICKLSSQQVLVSRLLATSSLLTILQEVATSVPFTTGKNHPDNKEILVISLQNSRRLSMRINLLTVKGSRLCSLLPRTIDFLIGLLKDHLADYLNPQFKEAQLL